MWIFVDDSPTSSVCRPGCASELGQEFRSGSGYVRNLQVRPVCGTLLLGCIFQCQTGYSRVLGATIHRLSKGKINVLVAEDGLHFTTQGNKPGWLSLVGGPNQDVKLRFTSGGDKGSTMGGATQRYHAPLGREVSRRKTAYDNRYHTDPSKRTDETWWEYHRRKQNPTGLSCMRLSLKKA